jgi:hypothetical protein
MRVGVKVAGGLAGASRVREARHGMAAMGAVVHTQRAHVVR